jgi:hypothetical protein
MVSDTVGDFIIQLKNAGAVGILTDEEARSKRMGGEQLFTIW